MFIAGAKDFPRDAWDDVSNIPFQKTHNTLSYRNADEALKQMMQYIQTIHLHQS